MSAPIPEDLRGIHTESMMRSEQDIIVVRPSVIASLVERIADLEEANRNRLELLKEYRSRCRKGHYAYIVICDLCKRTDKEIEHG